MKKDSVKRICLWSGPRNISTALMYSFAQRKDTLVVDEPLYAHYLKSTDADSYHPGAEEILGTMEQDGQKVIAKMLGPHEKEIVFFKQMTHHLVNIDYEFLKHTINIILTRDPKEMLSSYAKAIRNPSMKDVGYAAHLELYQYLESIDYPPIVLDSGKILLKPKVGLQNLCKKLNIPFLESMLSWNEGPIKEDGCWAKYWYKSVHNSTGFKPYKAKNERFPDHLNDLLSRCQPIYEQLSALSI